MTIAKTLTLLATAAAIGACNQKPAPTASEAGGGGTASVTPAAAHPTDPIESALAAAPASLRDGAMVIAMNPDGTMKTLREGNNGWTCMPNNPATPGADPMCMDANAMKWAEAWIGHKPPPADNVGLMYMLAGGSDASNMDPYGKEPAAGAAWVETGPHVMVVGADSLNKLYPSSDKPDTAKPYVMFGGTPYAHLMIPTG